MRTIPILSGAALVLVAAGVTMAASPVTAPATAPATQPAGAHPTAPAKSAAPAAAATPANGPWTAAVQPLNTTSGTATVVRAANGSGTITLKLTGLRPDARWTVDIDAGTLAGSRQISKAEIAQLSGSDLEKSAGTVKVHLTAAQMKAFIRDRSSMGVFVLVSDGTNQSAATFTGA
jgi:hypothetical protein